MKKKNVTIVAPYVTFKHEPGANRFIHIAHMLGRWANVELVTSRFCHFLKKHRSETPTMEDVKVTLIDEPGYPKNVGLMRVYSHRIFCKNLSLYLESAPRPDLYYVAYPMIEVARLVTDFGKKHNIRCVLDVQDVWPESIAGPIPAMGSSLGHTLMTPLTRKANRVYDAADALIAVSETYLNRANRGRLPPSLAKSIYIGAEEVFEPKASVLSDEAQDVPIEAIYLGTMGGCYDLETVVRAANLLNPKQVQVSFIGSGPLEKSLRELNDKLGGRARFLGVMPYKKAMARLREADVAINAIKKEALQSITNKISDYISAALPIVNSQRNKEVRELLNNKGEIFYEAGNTEQLANALMLLAKNPEKRAEMSKFNHQLARQGFHRDVSYQRIDELVKDMVECRV